MRPYAAALLVCLVAPSAWANPGLATEEDMRREPKAPSSREAEQAPALRDIVKQLRAARYKDIEIVPQVFVARAKNPSGEDVTIFIDVDTMRAVELGKPPAEGAGTTGSGSGEDWPLRKR
jgi:hypothetical protein